MGRCALASGWLSGPSCLRETTRWEASLTRNPWPPAAERVRRLVTPPRATRSLWCWTGSQVAGASPTPPARHPETPRGRPTGAWEKGRVMPPTHSPSKGGMGNYKTGMPAVCMTILKANGLTTSRLPGSPFSSSRSTFLPKLNFAQGRPAEPSRACVCTCACTCV